MTTEEGPNGLVCAFTLDGAGGGAPIGWDEIRAGIPKRGSQWIHLDRAAGEAKRWLREDSGLSSLACDALLAEETRPRVDRMAGGFIVVFRGVNLNPGANPEDMVSLRLWIDDHRLISVRHRHLMAIQDLRDRIAAGDYPLSPVDLLTQTGLRLAWRMEPVMSNLSDRVDDLENDVLTNTTAQLRSRMTALRREIIALRRYLAPQRDAMLRLQAETGLRLEDRNRFEMREAADRTTRYLEELDAARERVGVMHEELVSRLSEQLNQRMYLLSIIAAIFLPLSLITGLLGINVGGLPGANSDSAFMVVSVVLVVLGVGLAFLLRRMRFF
jgi:zinc transporter